MEIINDDLIKVINYMEGTSVSGVWVETNFRLPLHVSSLLPPLIHIILKLITRKFSILNWHQTSSHLDGFVFLLFLLKANNCLSLQVDVANFRKYRLPSIQKTSLLQVRKHN